MNKTTRNSASAQIRPLSGELDAIAQKEIEKRLRLDNEVSALVFGRDVGEFAGRLADSGAQVVIEKTAEKLPARTGLRALPFSLSALPDADRLPEAPFDIIVGQLVLHAIHYEEACTALSRLMQMLKIGGKLYLSAYGLYSILGDHYPDSGKLVEERFSELPASLADYYDLRGPVCLYSERNLITLLFKVGAPVLLSATGALGNVRAVAVRI